MKIAILTDVLDRSMRETGVPSYAKYLSLALSEKSIDLYLVHNREGGSIIYKRAKEIVLKPSWVPNFLKMLFILPVALKKEKIHTIHIMAPTWFEAPAMFLKGVKKIVTFHDIHQFVLESDFEFSYSYFRNVLRKFSFRFFAKKADHIITVSRNTKKDLIKILNVVEEKITVVHSATDVKMEKRDYPLKHSHFAQKPYILGSTPNLELLRIFLALQKKGLKHKLVIYGNLGGTILQKLKEFIEENKIGDSVIFTGHIIERELLVNVYSNADLLIHHMQYEGFGLPPLEAMSCGCPVMVSDVASLPEVVGDAGLLLELFKINDWVDAAFEILNSQEKMKKLREKGFDRAKKFSWDKSAEETMRVYKKVLEEI